MSFWTDVFQGAKDAFDYLGFTHFAEKEKAAALEDQFAKMSEAYKQYRTLNAQAGQNELAARLQIRAPQQQLVGKVLPGFGYEHATDNTQGLYDDTVRDILANANGTNPNGWPTAPSHAASVSPVTGSPNPPRGSSGEAIPGTIPGTSPGTSAGTSAGQGPAAAAAAAAARQQTPGKTFFQQAQDQAAANQQAFYKKIHDQTLTALNKGKK
jgi:hypothetical protein